MTVKKATRVYYGNYPKNTLPENLTVLLSTAMVVATYLLVSFLDDIYKKL